MCLATTERKRGGEIREREERKKARERERMKGGGRKKTWRNVM